MLQFTNQSIDEGGLLHLRSAVLVLSVEVVGTVALVVLVLLSVEVVLVVLTEALKHQLQDDRAESRQFVKPLEHHVPPQSSNMDFCPVAVCLRPYVLAVPK